MQVALTLLTLVIDAYATTVQVGSKPVQCFADYTDIKARFGVDEKECYVPRDQA